MVQNMQAKTQNKLPIKYVLLILIHTHVYIKSNKVVCCNLLHISRLPHCDPK